MLEEFRGHVFVNRIGLCEFQRHGKHREAIESHPGGSVRLLQESASWQFGCIYHSRRKRLSCFFAKCGSIFENGIMWKARSHAANQGYSHLSGIEMMSRLKR